jgi:hypothetical protein
MGNHLVMKIAATIYSLLFSGTALWAWASYFLYQGSTGEHLLPAIALNVLTLPSSLLLERVVVQVPWILNSPVAMLSIVTGLGTIQALLVWLMAVRFKFPFV